MTQDIPALLALADGTLWPGLALGAVGETTGEAVFCTSMTGYQEILTDPSYYGQVVTMSQPHIGNYGTNDADEESVHPWAAGLIVRAASLNVSNYRASRSLQQYMGDHKIVGITDVDTRALVRHLRMHGSQNCAISSTSVNPQRLIEMARSAPDMNGLNLVKHVTCAKPYTWTRAADGQWLSQMTNDQRPVTNDADGRRKTGDGSVSGLPSSVSGRLRVVAYDYGIKHNILELLTYNGCDVTVVPAEFPASEVLAMKPDGVFLSNGPGDPAACTVEIANIKQMLGKVPIFGICLGNQLLGLALGGSTYKLKFGHRGGNQPVQFSDNKAVEISTHNHGFAVDASSLPAGVEVTHLNLNDQCVEGLRAKALKAFAVQYHPESSPGPHDSHYLFGEFVKLMTA
jgi:carbamoyl-phosphate synthase small subunit